jgi:hypothetical protein
MLASAKFGLVTGVQQRPRTRRTLEGEKGNTDLGGVLGRPLPLRAKCSRSDARARPVRVRRAHPENIGRVEALDKERDALLASIQQIDVSRNAPAYLSRRVASSASDKQAGSGERGSLNESSSV